MASNRNSRAISRTTLKHKLRNLKRLLADMADRHARFLLPFGEEEQAQLAEGSENEDEGLVGFRGGLSLQARWAQAGLMLIDGKNLIWVKLGVGMMLRFQDGRCEMPLANFAPKFSDRQKAFSRRNLVQRGIITTHLLHRIAQACPCMIGGMRELPGAHRLAWGAAQARARMTGILILLSWGVLKLQAQAHEPHLKNHPAATVQGLTTAMCRGCRRQLRRWSTAAQGSSF